MPLPTLCADQISGDEEVMRSLKVVLYGGAVDGREARLHAGVCHHHDHASHDSTRACVTSAISCSFCMRQVSTVHAHLVWDKSSISLSIENVILCIP